MEVCHVEYIVRKARVEDAEAIGKINQKVLDWHAVVDLEKTLKRLLANEAHFILVAAAEDSILGYIHACEHDTLYSNGMKNIVSLIVDPSHRRQGVGTALLRAVEKWAAVGVGIPRIRMTLEEDREDAHAFYCANGYVGVKREINFKKKPNALR